ncbi:MAG: J domain-containing protein [Anaerolineae bacterium]|nr:J domain-containing protein [Anaerolineae bacterium]
MPRKIIYDPKRDYYDMLRLDTDASIEDVRLAYRQRVREFHPDLHPERAGWATEQLQLVNEAYDVLRQPALRKEYDRVRWPHSRFKSRSKHNTYNSPFSRPGYDPNLPWWEQLGGTAPNQGRQTSYARRHQAQQAAAAAQSQTSWLPQSVLRRLEPTLQILIGIWRSPYAGLLTLLSILLAINIAVLSYAFMAPDDGGPLNVLWNIFGRQTATPIVSPESTTTADRLFRQCSDPGIQISAPVDFDIVEGTFVIQGTVQHAELWHYTLEIGYLGKTITATSVPDQWRSIRLPPANQSLPEQTIAEGELTNGVNLDGQPSGYYAVRLRVTLRNGTELLPCDVVVRH